MGLDKEGYYPENHTSEPVDLRNETEMTPVDNAFETETQAIDNKYDDKDAKPMWESIVGGVSRILSWVLVPMLMPVYGLMAIFACSNLIFTPYDDKVVMVEMTALINVAVPFILILAMKALGLIEDVGLNNRKERIVPYIITIMCLGGTGFYLYLNGAPKWVSMFYVGGAATGIVNMLVNFKWKISAHAAGIAGVIAVLLRVWQSEMPTVYCMPLLIVSIILAGLLGSARIWLRRHTLGQVLCGYITGFLGVYLMTLI